MELLLKAGPVIWLIVIAFLCAGTVFIERVWMTRWSKVGTQDFVDKICTHIKNNEMDVAHALIDANDNGLSQIYRYILKYPTANIMVQREAAEEAGKYVVSDLSRGLSVVGTIATISPLLGLLGTVTGMISVFQSVAESGVGDPLQMASGIWEALLTTAFGISVGVPALIAHRYLSSRIRTRSTWLEQRATQIIDILQSISVEK